MNPEKKALYTAPRSTVIDLHTNSIVECWQKLRDDADTTNWMLTTIDGTTKIVHLAGCGDTCLSGLQGVVQDDDIYFGGVRVNINPHRSKFYHVRESYDCHSYSRVALLLTHLTMLSIKKSSDPSKLDQLLTHFPTGIHCWCQCPCHAKRQEDYV